MQRSKLEIIDLLMWILEQAIIPKYYWPSLWAQQDPQIINHIHWHPLFPMNEHLPKSKTSTTFLDKL